IGLVLTPLVLLKGLVELLPVFDPEIWQQLTEPGAGAYHPLWATVVIYELLANVGFLVFTLWLGYLFVRKSSRTPAIFITWLALNIAIQLVDLLLGAEIPAVADESAAGFGELIRGIIQAIIWIPYFLRSERVRNTFAVSSTPEPQTG
ncbi:MAG TPA: DUF2569 domain-containing protein, partial [Steroidobacteraceae bacterium]|nr:DUF2569 domain-containing protein [Steroidobacteraceae bacterium]